MKIYKDEITDKLFSKEAFLQTIMNMVTAIEDGNFGVLEFKVTELEVLESVRARKSNLTNKVVKEFK